MLPVASTTLFFTFAGVAYCDASRLLSFLQFCVESEHAGSSLTLFPFVPVVHHRDALYIPQGWRSVYVNEPGEVLAWCTHQPTNLTWRIKQVLRWHQGAVQLLYTKVQDSHRMIASILFTGSSSTRTS